MPAFSALIHLALRADPTNTSMKTESLSDCNKHLGKLCHKLRLTNALNTNRSISFA